MARTSMVAARAPAEEDVVGFVTLPLSLALVLECRAGSHTSLDQFSTIVASCVGF